MTTTLRQNLLDLSDFACQRLRERVEGLTDEEYFWSRSTAAGRSGRPRGASSPTGLDPAGPAPFTTLAWRITHIVDILQEERTATWLGHQPAADDGEPPVPESAEAALAALDHAYDVWRRRLAAFSQDDLDRAMGEIAGPWAEHDGTAFVLHILDELIHHGAEVGTLRDFYRGMRAEDPFAPALAGEITPAQRPALLAEAAAAQRWEVVPQLADLGFGINERTADGVTAAHLAAGTGSLDSLRLLVEHGADLSATDPRFGADVLGWAKWFKQPEAVAYLEGI